MSEHPRGDPQSHEHRHAHDEVEHDHAHAHASPPQADNPELDDRWIEIEHLHFAYPDGYEALRGVDLRIGRGQKVGLVGPNGAGKSTLLLHLNGIRSPTHGLVRIGGVAIDRSTVRRIRSEVALVFQDPDDQLFSPTVFDDVAFGPLHMGLPAAEIHQRVEQALESVGMAGLERRLPHHLSMGQRKRIAMATVLSMEPSVMAFDEPSAGLDPRGRRELIRTMASLPQTLVVATHDMRLVADVLERTIIMDNGIIVADGPTESILGNGPLLESHGLELP